MVSFLTHCRSQERITRFAVLDTHFHLMNAERMCSSFSASVDTSTASDLSSRRFLPNFYQRSTESDNALGVQKGEMPRSCKKFHPFHFHHHEKSSVNGYHWHHEDVVRELERHYSQSIAETDVEEVWFAGCHCGMCSAGRYSYTLNLLLVCRCWWWFC